MIVGKYLSLLVLVTVLVANAATASAAPSLRGSIVVDGDLVTAGDLFKDAGPHAATPLFRAPAPGTVGAVDLAAIERAALRAGIGDFDPGGMAAVRVERTGIAIDTEMLAALLADELRSRDLIGAETSLAVALDAPLGRLFAATTDGPPVVLAELTTRAAGRFSARLVVPGHPAAIVISGQYDETIPAPHLIASLARDAVIGPTDVEMRPVALRRLGAEPALGLQDVVGMAVRRNIRAGNLIGPGDIAPPTVIDRNDAVTLTYRAGPLTLTLRGRALAAAAVGEPLAVLNPMSNRVVHGVVVGPGEVAVGQSATARAGVAS